MRVIRGRQSRFGEMMNRYFERRPGHDVLRKTRLAVVDVNRRATAASHEVIHPMRAGLVGVPLDPMVEQMIVAGDRHPNVMLAEQGDVEPPKRFGRALDNA